MLVFLRNVPTLYVVDKWNSLMKGYNNKVKFTFKTFNSSLSVTLQLCIRKLRRYMVTDINKYTTFNKGIGIKVKSTYSNMSVSDQIVWKQVDGRSRVIREQK